MVAVLQEPPLTREAIGASRRTQLQLNAQAVIALAQASGLSVSTVRRLRIEYAQAHECPMALGRPRLLTEERARELAALLAVREILRSELSLKALAARFGLSPCSIEVYDARRRRARR